MRRSETPPTFESRTPDLTTVNVIIASPHSQNRHPRTRASSPTIHLARDVGLTSPIDPAQLPAPISPSISDAPNAKIIPEGKIPTNPVDSSLIADKPCLPYIPHPLISTDTPTFPPGFEPSNCHITSQKKSGTRHLVVEIGQTYQRKNNPSNWRSFVVVMEEEGENEDLEEAVSCRRKSKRGRRSQRKLKRKKSKKSNRIKSISFHSKINVDSQQEKTEQEIDVRSTEAFQRRMRYCGEQGKYGILDE